MTEEELSPRARKLLDRVRDQVNWYPAYGKGTPQAMEELVDAGFVGIGGRVVSMQACYMPIGTEPLRQERFPRTVEALKEAGLE